jgi:hypothetical protein
MTKREASLVKKIEELEVELLRYGASDNKALIDFVSKIADSQSKYSKEAKELLGQASDS